MTVKGQIAHKKSCYKILNFMSQPLQIRIHIHALSECDTSKEGDVKLELRPLADLVNQGVPSIPGEEALFGSILFPKF